METDFMCLSLTTGPTPIFSGVLQEQGVFTESYTASTLAFSHYRGLLSVV